LRKKPVLQPITPVVGQKAWFLFKLHLANHIRDDQKRPFLTDFETLAGIDSQ
jgi:hypothetical protein